MHPNKHNLLSQKGAYALFCVFISALSHSQVIPNLVNNYSFEDTIKCPTNMGQLYNCKHWFNPVVIGTPDYYNSCSNSYTIASPSTTRVVVPSNNLGYQFPRTGNSYVGIGTYVSNYPQTREYIKTKLKASLKSNSIYCLTFYVSRSDSSIFANANIGAYFSNDSMISSNPWPPYLITANPILEETSILYDTANWIPITGTVSTTGNENFLTIGNFRNDAATSYQQTKPLYPHPVRQNYSYYYIDDVSVIEINSANAAIKDTLTNVCFMDSIILGTDSTEFATYQWQSTAAGLAALSCTNCPNPIAKPFVTTKYYLTKQQCSSTTIDSVTVVVLTPTTQANAGNDKVICIGESIQIGTNDSLKFTSYNWQGSGGSGSSLSCTNCAVPYVKPTVSTTYTVQRTECATVTSDTVRVLVDDCDPTFTVPNVFTPNYDDVNDTWGINFSSVNAHITNFKMSIYDRWGLLVYETNPSVSVPNSKWDGHTTSGVECSPGVYYYIITFEKNGEHVLLKGHLSLFR
jgi:gliding motility-associated-like protein